jgi:hypothetical protein
MKTIRRVLPWLLLVLVACAGAIAREEVQLPSMQMAWSNVRAQVADQLLHAPDDSTTATLAAADQALATGNATALAAVDWEAIEAAAEVSIRRREQAQEIGPHVAESLRERLRQFSAARKTYTRTP